MTTTMKRGFIIILQFRTVILNHLVEKFARLTESVLLIASNLEALLNYGLRYYSHVSGICGRGFYSNNCLSSLV
jgi:hypothetical protein